VLLVTTKLGFTFTIRIWSGRSIRPKTNITAQPAIQTDWNTQNIRYITTSETVHVFLWTVPSAVASLEVIERGPDYLVVKWTPPASPNGNVLSYRIEYKVGK